MNVWPLWSEIASIRITERSNQQTTGVSRARVRVDKGFSLHTGTVCKARQRSNMERLCRYTHNAIDEISKPQCLLRAQDAGPFAGGSRWR